MDSSSSNYSMSLILEDKVSDLESKLSYTVQALRTKEHVLRLQQEQIKKMEDMYKKCLDDMANVTCEHKKTLHDLENLRIILKSYENRKLSVKDFQCQVDLPIQDVEQHQNEELLRINEILLIQCQKTDHIIQLLQNVSTDKIEAVQVYIEELQRISQSLADTNEQRNNQLLTTRSMMFPIIEEADTAYSAKYKLMDFANYDESMSIVMEHGSQTMSEMKDISFNCPEQITSSMIQTILDCCDREMTTDKVPSENKLINCELGSSVSCLIQTTFFDDIASLKASVQELEVKVDVDEGIIERHLQINSEFETLIQTLERKQNELDELRQTVGTLNAMIERHSYLTMEQIKDLCKDITMRTGEDYNTMATELNTLRAEVDMLRTENNDLANNHSVIPRAVIELCNRKQQTDYLEDDASQEIATLGNELELAHGTIRDLQNKIEQFETSGNTLDELKTLCRTLNSEASQMHNSQLSEIKEKYERKVQLLEAQILAVEEQRDTVIFCASAANDKPEMITTSTQIYGWAALQEQLDTLKVENEELIKHVTSLKAQVELDNVNRNAMEELKIMCMKLGQNMNESTTVKRENITLKQQLEEAINAGHKELEVIQQNYYDSITKAREEIYSLRLENKELAEGVEEIKLVVNVNTQFETLPAGSKPNSSSGSSEEMLVSSMENLEDIPEVEPQPNAAELKALSSTSDLEELKSLCKGISKRLKYKKLSHHSSDERFELLASLENDLKILMKEFLDFKWTSQTENQKLLIKQSEISAQNEELVNCLNQYKTVNESLLKSHYELEKDKNMTAMEHQALLEEYLKLQEELDSLNHQQRARGPDRSTNTTLTGREVLEVEIIKTENIEVLKQNLKLKAEIDNLLRQINDQHMTCLQKLQENIDSRTCEQCVTTLKTLQTLNVDFKNVNNENTLLKSRLMDKESQMGELKIKYMDLTRDILDYSKLKSDLDHLQGMHHKCEKQNEDLVNDLQKLQNQLKGVRGEKEVLFDQYEVLHKEFKQVCEELVETKDKVRDNEHELDKYQDEVKMLQTAIAKVSCIKEKYAQLEGEAEIMKAEICQKNMMIKCNDSLLHEYRILEDQLKTATDAKDKLEVDFESYIRTNNLLQQTMTKQNESLLEDLRTLKDENEKLQRQLKELQHTSQTSRTELVRVVDECKNYKSQLEDMARRIDFHLKEHLEYKTEVEQVKRTLQEEISNLKQMLEMQHLQLDAFDVVNYEGNDIEKHKQELRAFINTKELEIDYLMGQKLKAMEAIGNIEKLGDRDSFRMERERNSRSRRTRDEDGSSRHTSTDRDLVKVHVNFKKTSRDKERERGASGPSARSASVQSNPTRSSSMPRARLMRSKTNPWEKDTMKRQNTVIVTSETGASRSSGFKRQVSNVAKKK